MQWKISSEQKKFLNILLKKIPQRKIHAVLDVGGGRTSIQYLTNRFPKVIIESVVYPGDQRKILPIRESVTNTNYRLIEKDLMQLRLSHGFDLTLAHLFLGEAKKFNRNAFTPVLKKLFAVPTMYLAIVDFIFDPDVDYTKLFQMIEARGELVEMVYQPRKSSERREWRGMIGLLIRLEK